MLLGGLDKFDDGFMSEAHCRFVEFDQAPQ